MPLQVYAWPLLALGGLLWAAIIGLASEWKGAPAWWPGGRLALLGYGMLSGLLLGLLFSALVALAGPPNEIGAFFLAGSWHASLTLAAGSGPAQRAHAIASAVVMGVAVGGMFAIEYALRDWNPGFP